MLTQAQIRAAWAPACKGPWVRVNLHGNGSVQVRGTAYNAVKALDACLKKWNYRTRAADTGGYNCRPTAGGASKSTHAYGIAIDINWKTNPYGRTLKTDMPRAMINAICAIRTNNGKQVWNWGGFWSGNKDAMHYEIVCSPRDLATGINPRTVPGAVVAPAPAPKPPAGQLTPAQWAAMAKAVEAAKKTTLRRGSKGDAVKWAQAFLNQKVVGANLKVDGDYGPATERAAIQFQKNVQKFFKVPARELPADGIIGPKTWFWLAA